MSVYRIFKNLHIKSGPDRLIAWNFHVKRLSSGPGPANTNEETPGDEQITKERILEAALKHVLQLGWSREALTAGAQEVGCPGVAHGMFPKGGGDLVHYFQLSSNRQLVSFLKTEVELGKQHVPADLVESAIRYRLELLVPYVTKWPQALAVMALPHNMPNALATLLTTVDDICYYAGDRSVNYNWYARRVGVAGVYKATELYLVQDGSPGQVQTWEFLHKRLQEAVQIHDLLMKSDLASKVAKDTVSSAFVTARNILGLNWNR